LLRLTFSGLIKFQTTPARHEIDIFSGCRVLNVIHDLARNIGKVEIVS
jgi:hypothetical protein